MNARKIVAVLLGVLVWAAGASTWLAGCTPPQTGNGGITWTLLGGIVKLTFFDIGPIETRANETVSVPTGFRLFEKEPPETPPTGQMTLPSTSVGVGRRLTAKTIVRRQTLPLNGFATIRFKIAAGQSATLCDSAVLLAEFEMDLTFGVASIRNQVFDLSQEAIRVMMANDVTICIEITADFDGEITIGEYFFAFGGGTGGDQPPSAIEGPPILPGGLTQVPIDSLGGRAVATPVNRTISGIVYGVVGVLEANTPAVTPPAVEPGTISVVPAELGLLTVETLYLGTHSSFVPDVSGGVTLATLTVSYTDSGPATTLDFITGSTTAEWSYDRPEHTTALGGVQHAQAPVLYSFETTIGSAFTYDGFSYSVALPVDSFRTISALTLAVTDPATYAASRLETGPLAGWAGQAITAITLAGQALVIAQEEACCFDDGSCADLEQDDCIAVLGTPQGEGTSCATTDCPSEGEEPEVCCVPPLPGYETIGESFAQSCVPIGTQPYETRDDCRFFGGVPQGQGTTCANTVCDEDFRACCPQASCAELLFDDCFDAGGDPQGSGVHCDDLPCGDATEACCFDDGQCTDTDPDTCQANGGDPQGSGVHCDDFPCGDATEACCYDDGSCVDTDPDTCQANGGDPQGSGVHCDDLPCGDADEACCLDDGSCADTDLLTCAFVGESQGPGSTCATATCPPPLGGCCFNDTLDCFGPISADDCLNTGGTPLPDCDPVPDPCLFACCRPNDPCTEALTVDQCDAANGTVNARGTTCADVTCAPAVPGIPTIAVCPASFVFIDGYGVAVNAVLDDFLPDQGFGGDSGVCVYIAQDAFGSQLNMWMVFGPAEDVGCGQQGEIFESGAAFWSTQRTIQVNSGGLGSVVDWEGFAGEFIANGVNAGVGLLCP